MDGKRLTENELESVIANTAAECKIWAVEAEGDPLLLQNRDDWGVLLRALVELRELRAELDALRANFAELAGVDLPETGEGDGMV